MEIRVIDQVTADDVLRHRNRAFLSPYKINDENGFAMEKNIATYLLQARFNCQPIVH